jgi:hypothetical protein
MVRLSVEVVALGILLREPSCDTSRSLATLKLSVLPMNPNFLFARHSGTIAEMTRISTSAI